MEARSASRVTKGAGVEVIELIIAKPWRTGQEASHREGVLWHPASAACCSTPSGRAKPSSPPPPATATWPSGHRQPARSHLDLLEEFPAGVKGNRLVTMFSVPAQAKRLDFEAVRQNGSHLLANTTRVLEADSSPLRLSSAAAAGAGLAWARGTARQQASICNGIVTIGSLGGLPGSLWLRVATRIACRDWSGSEAALLHVP